MVKNIGLLYDRIRWDEKAIIEKAKKKGIDLKLIDAKNLNLQSHAKEKEIQNIFGNLVLQRCISYFRGLHLTAYMENKNIKVVNSFKVAQVCGNKMFTTLALVKAGIPTPKTIMTFSSGNVIESLEKIGYPAVLKPVIGSWGRQVSIIKDKDVMESIIELREMMNNPLYKIYYIQEMVKRPPRDIRTIVVGDEIVTAVYRYAPEGEWRTNVARGGKSIPYLITKEFEDLILKAAKTVGNGILAIDAMESQNEILIHEINNTVEFKGAMSATDADVPGVILDYLTKEE